MASKYYNREKNRENQHKHRRTFGGTISAKLHGSRRNAKAKGYEHTLDREFLIELWERQKGLCALSGAKLGYVGSGWCSASLDRINPKWGYVPKNVQWVCWRVNDAKADMTDDDFVNMCTAIASKFVDKVTNELRD